MSDLVSRVREALDNSGLSASKASEEAGLGRRFINDLLDGSKKSIAVDKAEKLAKVFGCSPEWLAFGRGDKNEKEEAVVVDIWDSILDEKQRKAWLDMGKSLADKKSQIE